MDHGPKTIRLDIVKDESVGVTFISEDRTRVMSSDLYYRHDLYAKALNKITLLQDKLADMQEYAFKRNLENV